MDHYDELLSSLLQQEEELQFTSFTNETAFRIGCRIVENAKQAGKSIVVDIERNGMQLFHCSMDGKTPNNTQWITRKNRVVRHFGRSSLYMRYLLLSKQTTLLEWAFLDPNEYAAVGGAFPLIVKDVGVVGTITVSGLAQEEDHQLVVSVLQEFCAGRS